MNFDKNIQSIFIKNSHPFIQTTPQQYKENLFQKGFMTFQDFKEQNPSFADENRHKKVRLTSNDSKQNRNYLNKENSHSNEIKKRQYKITYNNRVEELKNSYLSMYQTSEHQQINYFKEFSNQIKEEKNKNIDKILNEIERKQKIEEKVSEQTLKETQALFQRVIKECKTRLLEEKDLNQLIYNVKIREIGYQNSLLIIRQGFRLILIVFFEQNN